jgi:hypothetical protein
MKGQGGGKAQGVADPKKEFYRTGSLGHTQHSCM